MAISNQQGFTLVELSIVLVIIGTLIGGILIGQSLIESAKVNSLVSNIGQWEIAINTFKQKFKNYPGDSQHFTPPGLPSNVLGSGANGVSACAAAPNPSLSNSEINQVWAHLSESKMLNEDYPAYSPNSNCGGVHTIGDLISGKYWPNTEVDQDWHGYSSGGASSNTRGIIFSKSTSSNKFSFSFFVKPNMTVPIDTKMGAKDFVSIPPNGLVRYYSFGWCRDGDNDDYNCNETYTGGNGGLAGLFYYFLAPQ